MKWILSRSHSNEEKRDLFKIIIGAFPRSKVAVETFKSAKSLSRNSGNTNSLNLANETRKLQQILGMVNSLQDI